MLVVCSLLLTFLLILPYREQVRLATTLAPIDDPLLEAYAKAVVDKNGPYLLAQLQWSVPVFIIEDSFYQAFEPAYSKDPKFWQMRYLTAGGKLPAPYNSYEFEEGHREYYLGRAMDEDIYDAATLVLWINSLLYEPYITAYACDEAKQLQAESNEPTIQCRYAAEFAFTEHEQEVRTLVNRLLEEYPDEGWGYLLAAECELYTGNQEVALDRLQEFVKAKHHNRLAPYPLSANFHNLQLGQSIGNPAFSGLLTHLEGFHSPFVDRAVIADALSMLTIEAVEQQDMHQLAIIHDAIIQLAYTECVEPGFKNDVIKLYFLFVYPTNSLKINYKPTSAAEQGYLFNLYGAYETQFLSTKPLLEEKLSTGNSIKSNASKLAYYVLRAKTWTEQYQVTSNFNIETIQLRDECLRTRAFKEFAAIDFSKLHCDGVWEPDEEQ